MVLMASMCTLAACTPSSLRDLVRTAEGAVEAATTAVMPSDTIPGDPVLAFLAEAEEGEVRNLHDSATSAQFRVTAGRIYHAASGGLCRRFIVEGATTPEASRKGLACSDATGRWIRVDLLAPVAP